VDDPEDDEWDGAEDGDSEGSPPLGDDGEPVDLFGSSRPLPADVEPTLIELEKIPRHLWEQTLAALLPPQRIYIANQVKNERLRDHAHQIAFDLFLASADRRNAEAKARHDALRAGHPLPAPHFAHPANRASVQVNLRLRRDDHTKLAQAAEAVGLKPTTLARSLVLNGVAMILRDNSAG
jgi:hypothetical protein